MHEYIRKILSELIAEKTVNYDPSDYPDRGPDGMSSPGEEHRVAKIVTKELESKGVAYKVFHEDSGRPDVFAFFGNSRPGFRRILIAAHMDTVPSGSGWSKPPFEPALEGDRLYGRGAEDNKGQLAALLASIDELKNLHIEGQVILAAVSDEEVRMCPGLSRIIEQRLIDVTDAITPDVGGAMKKIVVGEKGRLVVSVVARGKAAHASRPHQGENAIAAMSSFLSALSSYQLPHTPDPLFPEGPTVNVGMVRGGDAPNQVPEWSEAILDIRFLPSQLPEEIIKALQNISPELPLEFAIRGTHAPMLVSDTAPLVQAIQRHAQAKCAGIGGGTVSKILVANGIDAVGFSAGDEDAAHTADEWIDVSELVEFAKLIPKIAADVANSKQTAKN